MSDIQEQIDTINRVLSRHSDRLDNFETVFVTLAEMNINLSLILGNLDTQSKQMEAFTKVYIDKIDEQNSKIESISEGILRGDYDKKRIL